MSDYGEDDYDDNDLGYDYIYVEDDYAAADDLAEHAIASPPYTFYEFEAEHEDYDPYEYFNDIEYTSDGYFDDIAENGKLATPNRLKQKGTKASDPQVGQKRKAASSILRTQPARKKAKVAHQDTFEEELPPTVVWVPWNERPGISEFRSGSKDTATTGPFALLADWRDRVGKFKATAGETETINELEVPKPESEDEDEDEDGDVAEEDEVEDLDDDDNVVDGQAFEGNLQKIIGEKLAASGLSQGMDQSTLLQAAIRMLSSEGDTDDIAGELAKNLLGKATEGPEAEEITQWLGEQGVNLEEEEENGWQTENDDATEEKRSVVTSPPPSLPSAKRPPTPESTQSSKDSLKSIQSAHNLEWPPNYSIANSVVPAIRGGAGPSEPRPTNSRKRKAAAPQQIKQAEQDEEAADEPPPAKRVASYAAPTASSRSKAMAQPSRTRGRNTGKKA